MEQAQLDTVKQLIALDLVHQCIVDTTTGIGQLTQNAEDVIMPTRPSSSPEANAPAPGTQSEGSQQQQESTPGVPIQDEPLATLPKDLTTNRRAQWNHAGVQEQKPDSSRWRTPRRQPVQTPVEIHLTVDCPEIEHVLLDGNEGLPVKIMSLNLGTSGLKGSLDQLASYLHDKDIAAIHLQEVRMKHTELTKWRRIIKQKLPKYAMYAHCYHGKQTKNTAVVTLVLLELAKWISPACVNSADAALSSSIIALLYSPPHLQSPLLLANVWMPHSGYATDTIRQAHSAVTDLILYWKAKGYPVLAAGDWNATLTDSQRWGPTPTMGLPRVTDAAFRTLLTVTGMQAPVQCSSPTWESSTGTYQATLG